MKILFVALKYDYGIQKRGYSFEYYSFYDTLIGMGHEVEYFDFYTLSQQYGSLEMTRMLRRRVEEWNPELMFVFMFTDQFDLEELRKITTKTKTTTFNWFADDHWRFEDFSCHWAPCFSYVSTTDEHAIPKYHAHGYSNVLLTQWAANTRLWKPGYEKTQYEVTFIGQAHGSRRQIINGLRKQGLAIDVWGSMWNLTRLHRLFHKIRFINDRMLEEIIDLTRISQKEMIRIIRASKINLNLSASSQIRHHQIKGRNFEIPACGGFQISGNEAGLEKYFQLDKEIVCYQTQDELSEKIKYYLTHERERSSIAEAGYKRVLKEHTYEQRFSALFRQMNLE